MRFLFVDAVVAKTDIHVNGRRAFPVDDPMRYALAPGQAVPVIAPGAVSEAIGQLASWLCLEKNAFAARPVFLFADKITVSADVPIGATVDLEADIEAMDAETFRFSGTAHVDGRLVQTIQACSGYFMPLAELEDPAEAKRRYAALTSGGIRYDGAGGAAFPFDTLAGDTVALEKGDDAATIRTSKTFGIEEPFYKDHFPRFPVTPIVMLNEMIGQATMRLAGKRLRVQEISGIKIRSFVKPGDRVETRVRIAKSADALASATSLEAATEVLKDGRPILRGTYTYSVME